MFLNKLIQKRLASLLQPWLRPEMELELEVKVGFLRSHAIAKNLRLDTSALNRSLDESSPFSFKDVKIELLILTISNWSVPSFTIEVHGLHLTLSLGEVEERLARSRRTPMDSSAEDMRKLLSEIDPEGSALHDAMKRISETTCSRSRTTSLLNIILMHCRLQMHDVHLLVQSPISNDSFSCLFEIKELNAESRFIKHGCFLRGLITTLFVPSRDCYLDIDVRGFEIGLKSKDRISHVVPSTNLLTSIELKDLQPINSDFCVSKLEFSFSPADLSIILAFNELSAKSKSARHGKQLWKIAASRISSLIPTPRWSFHKVVNIVCLWLRYSHAYENLLLVVGYPVDNIIKRSVMMMLRDKIYSKSVKHQWKEISGIEKELPAEAVALARRVSRYRAAVNVNRSKDSSSEPLVNICVNFFWKIRQLLALVWNTIFSTFKSVVNFLFLHKLFAVHSKTNEFIDVSEASCPQHCFSVNMGIILITISPENAVQPPLGGKAVSDIGISRSEILSFCLSIDSFLLIYNENICEQCLSFSVGHFKVISSPIVMGDRKKEANDSEMTLWSEPAGIFNRVETTGTGTADGIEGTSVPILDTLLREMWLDWKKSCTKLEESKIWYPENSSILCESKSFLTDQGLKSTTSGFWKCCLVVGKMNLVLGYSSILSLALLLRQIQQLFYHTDSNDRANVTSLAPTISEGPPASDWDGKCKSYVSGVETAVYRMLPEKFIQIGVFVAGPHLRISPRKESFYVRNTDVNPKQDDIDFAFDIRNIELAVSPNFTSDSTAVDDAELALIRLKELEMIDVSKSENENFKCQGRTLLCAYLKVDGLNVYLHDSFRNQQYQIIVLNPMTIQLSSTREELHAFGTTYIAVSGALHGVATGLTVLLFMDELFHLVEEMVGLSSTVSRAFTMFDSTGGLKCQELIKQEMAHDDSKSKVPLMSTTRRTLVSSAFVFNCTSELKSIDIVLHKSRESNHVEEYMTNFAATSSKRKLPVHDMPDYGVCVSVHQSFMEFSFKEEIVDVLTNFSGVRAVIFRYANEVEKRSGQFDLSSVLLHSLDVLYEASISDCMFSLWLRFLYNNFSSEDAQSPIGTSFPVGKVLHTVDDSSSTIDTGGSRAQSFTRGPQFVFSRNIIHPASSHWLVINVALSEIYLAECPVKDFLVGAHQSKKLELSVSVGRECRTICCQMQGGSIFIETTALVMFFQCFTTYLCCIEHLLPIASEEHLASAPGEDMAIMDNHPTQETNLPQQILWEKLEALTIDISHFSLILVARDELGRLQELLFGADVHLNYEVADMRRKFSFGLSNLSILSHTFHVTVERKTSEIKIPQFFSVMSKDLSSHFTPGNPKVAFQSTDGMRLSLDDESCSSPSVPQKESYVENSVSQLSNLSPQNYILKQLGAFVAVEKYVPRDMISTMHSNQLWVGGGSISGFDMTISLPEIQMILAAVESLSEVFSKETTDNVEQRHWSSNQESERSFEEMAPDGTIVAIQDVHQHTYITVEGAENKYSLVGAIHYSLVGERALFRVNYHYQRRWNSSVLWFSLTSLHAKSDSGELLRLNCRSGSSFVDISSSNDSRWALWRIFPYKLENYEDDPELQSYSPVAKNTFHLVNRKNDRCIAFVDGVLEFVSKPGNPFKLKVFQDHSLPRDISLANIPHTSQTHLNEEGTSVTAGNLSCINVAIERITLTIVHELSDTKEKFPLLQGSATFTDFMVQIMHTKARVMSKLEVVLQYYDAQKNLWEEFVHPVEICIFYRSRFQIQGSEHVLHGVPVHFYTRIKELDISITELSLDILLFVIGKLNLAGPYTVRSSMILANCCKVENQSGLTLLCHFYDNQDASIGKKQSATIFLRQLALVNQHPEASFVSIQLAKRGAFSTSPIHLSLLEAKAFAWRTRIVSLKDSKTYPGPNVVVEISRKTEDGLSIVVSPLLRIHNETDFKMELRFQRPQQEEAEYASVVLEEGDSIDDSMAAFGAINLTGGVKKALMALSVGNFLFSFRPESTHDLLNFEKSLSVEWSDDLKGRKAVRLSGLFDKLSYQVKKAFSIESVKCSFTTSHCSLRSEDGHVADIHFLIQSIERGVPVIQPDKSEYAPANINSSVALQEQMEIFLLPTVRVSNLLQTEICVLLTDKDPIVAVSYDNIGKKATIPCGSTVNLYANPDILHFIVTLTEFNSSCKPVNSSQWIKKLQKQKSEVHGLDIELDFGGGKYFAFLRLSCGHRGILEAAILTSYTLKNDTDYCLYCFAPNEKPLSRDEAEKFGSRVPPELGSFLPPKSTRSWFMKQNKLCLKMLEEKASEVLLDLDALSGLTEIDLEVEEKTGLKYITKLGVSLRPFVSDTRVPAHVVSMNPRYIISNESEEGIIVRQCYLEDDTQGMVTINSKERTSLQLWSGRSKRRELSLFENFIKKHRSARDDSLPFIQFRPSEIGLGWSGPVCVASLGRFFLKFRRSVDISVRESNSVTAHDKNILEFASVHVAEEGSSLVLHFHRPPNINLPYRIENCLHDAPISYYQKGSSEPETLGSGSSVNYVWDDSTLPHKLAVQISDVHLLREINLDKVRGWKTFYRASQQRGLGFQLPQDGKLGQKKRSFRQLSGMEMVKFGYEVYADGPTRVLRICELSDSRKGDTVFHSSVKIRLRVSYFSVHLLGHAKQEIDTREPSASVYTPIIVLRLGNINLDSVFTDLCKFNQIRVQSLSVDEKWAGAPFAAMLRRHISEYDTNDSILHVVLILVSSTSNVRQVKYSSIVLQPLDLNLDEETLMRIVPFWRTSLSDSSTPSQQYYFDHFEIHPIKIITSFLPGDSSYSYSSTQETLRSLLHSVIKIPAIKKTTVELNGVLVTHALITIRELCVKCAQHYSWYGMRAIYIAKGSPLLPPAFASVFDDMASSSLDVFFDPSSGLISLPGLTVGTFKLISKCIDGKGFSGTKRYFGDLGKTLKTAGSSILFAAVTEVSDSVLKGAEASGFNGMIIGFHQGILKLAMEPSVLGSALMEGGPDRKIKLDRNPGVDELYIEGYLQAMLDTIYKQEYLRVRVIDNQVVLKNLPPNSSLIDEIMDRVKGFLVSKALLKGDSSSSRPLSHLRGESEWRIGPTVLTLCEHLFVSFAIRMLRKQAGKIMGRLKWKKETQDEKAIVPADEQKVKLVWKWSIGKFIFSGVVAYLDGRLCRCIPNPVVRRIVSGFLLSFLDRNDNG